MSTMHSADLGAPQLWSSTNARRILESYTAKSSGTPTQSASLVWHILKAGGFNISGPDQRLAEITALEAVTEKPNQVAYSNARRTLHLAELFDIEPTQVTASAEGGVALCFKIDGMYADIECFNSGEMWAIISDRINPASTWLIENTASGIGAALLRIKSEMNA